MSNNTIQIKRNTSGAPSSLDAGELAVNLTDKKLWVGNNAGDGVLHLNDHLPLAGGTLTGDLEVQTASGGELFIDRNGNSGVLLQQKNNGADNSGSLKLQSGTSTVFTSGGTDILTLTSTGGTLTGSLTGTDANFERSLGNSQPTDTTSSIYLKDTASLAAGIGGSIVFSGRYSTNNFLGQGPYVRGVKINATSADYSYGLAFGTRKNGVNVSAEAARFDEDGALLINTTSKGTSTGKLYAGSPYTASAAIAQFNGFLRFGFGITHDATRGINPNVTGQGSIGLDGNRYGKGFFNRLDIGGANAGEQTSFGDLVVKQQGDANTDGFAVVGTSNSGNSSLRLWVDSSGNRKINAGTTEVFSFTTSAINLLQSVTASGTGHLFGKLNVGSVNNSFDFYNNGTSYFNGAVTVDDNLTVSDRLTVSDTSGADGLVIAGGENTGISARLFFETGTSGQGISILNVGGSFQFRTGATAGSSSGVNRLHLTTGGTLYPEGNDTTLGLTTKRWQLRATSGNFSGQAEFQNKLHLIGLTLDSSQTPSYIKIKTKIPFASSAADFTVNIKGFQYGSARTVDLKICWHYYNSTFYNATISSAGGWLPTAQLSAEDDNGTDMVCIVLASPGYWPKMYVESAYSKYYGSSTNYFTGWTWTDAAATGTGNKLVTLTYNNKFGNVQATGTLSVSGTSTFYGSLDLQDNDKLLLGAGNDLQIYHDGSNSYIKEASTGDIILDTNSNIRFKSSTEHLLSAAANGAVELYYDNSKTFETKANGAKLTQSTGYLFGGDGEILAGQDSSGYYFAGGAGQNISKPVFIGDNASYIKMKVGDAEKFRVTTTGATVSGSLTANALYASSNGVALGTSSNGWRLYSNNADVSGTLTVTGTTNLSGNTTSWVNIGGINAFKRHNSFLYFGNGGFSGGAYTSINIRIADGYNVSPYSNAASASTTLGTSSYRWPTIYGAAGNFNAGLTLSNGTSLHWDNENTRILASHASQYIRFDVGGTSNVLYATPTYVSFTPKLIAGSTSTNGGSWLEKNYTGSNKINVLSSHYSSGNTIIGYGVAGKSGSNGYVATYGNFSGGKAALEVANNAFYFKVADSAAQHSIGDDVTLNTRLAVDKNALTYTSSDGSGLIVNRTAVTAYLQLFPSYSNVPTIMGKGAGGLHLSYNSSSSGIRIDTSNNVHQTGNLTVGGRLTVSDTSGADGLVIAGGENTGISARLFFETGTSGQGTSILNVGGGFQFRTGATAGSSSGAERMHLSSGGTLYPQSNGQDLGTSTKRWELKATSGDFSGNITLNSRLTFSYNSHYFEAGTNSVAFKNSSGTAYLLVNNTGTTVSANLTVGGTTSLGSSQKLQWGDAATYITGSNSGDFLQFYPDGNVQLTLNSSGATIEDSLSVTSTGTETAPTMALGYGYSSAYRLSFYTDTEAGYISNKHGNNGIRFRHRQNTVMQVGYGTNTSTPYVGIGTVAPAKKLHVVGDHIRNESSTSGVYSQMDGDGLTVYRSSGNCYLNYPASGSSLVVRGPSYAEAMRIDSSKNATFYGTNFFCNANNSANPSGGGLYVNRSGGLHAYALATARSGTALNGVDLWDYHGVGLILGHNSSTKMLAITSTGVGINTVSPYFKCDIHGGSSVPLRLVSSGYAGTEYHNTAGTWAAYVGTESGGGGNRYNSAASKHTFYNNSSAAVTIDSTGLGVGVTAPSAKLHVSNSASSGGTFKFTDGSSRTLMDLGGGILSWNAGSVMGAGSWAGTADHQFQTLTTSRNTVQINGPASGTNYALYVNGTSYLGGNSVLNGNLYFGSTTGSFINQDSSNLRLAGDNGVKLQTYSGGWQNRLVIADDGDIDISQRLGIGGTHSNSYQLYVNGTSYFSQRILADDDIDFQTAGDYITFYGDSSRKHAISSRNSSGNAADDLRINTYGALFINLDSNDNNSSGADFSIGRHGDTGAISDWLLDLSGETGQLRLNKYGGSGLTGTVAKYLAVDSSGNVIQTDGTGSGSGGSGTVNETHAAGTNHEVAVHLGSSTVGEAHKMIYNSGSGLTINTTSSETDSTYALYVAGGIKNSTGGLYVTGDGYISSRLGVATSVDTSYGIKVAGYIASYGHTTWSDYRLKDNATLWNTSEAATLVKDVPVYSYRWNDNCEAKSVQDQDRIGFLAHEVSERINKNNLVINEKDGEKYQSVNQTDMIPILWAALQDALKRIEELEAI